MKNILLAICISAIGLTLPAQSLNPHLKTLLDSGEFFRFRKDFERDSASLDAFQREYFSVYKNYLFYKPVEADFCINRIFSSGFSLKDSVAAELLELKVQNDFRLCHYADADSVCAVILDKYAGVLSKKDADDMKNTKQIVSAIKNVPAQTMVRSGDMDVVFKRDAVGLIKLPVSVNDNAGDYVMDSGANFSTVTESEAKRVGVRVLDADINVTSSSRAAVGAKMGVCDKIKIGNITFHNVIFIVLPDKSLKFLGGLYKIKGIVGLPVIAQLGEIRISKDNHLFSPQTQTVCALQNLGLEGNTPFTEVNVFGQSHSYIFDTGAAGTFFDQKFARTYKDSIASGKMKKTVVGGAGGMQKVSILKLKNVHYAVGGNNNILKLGVVQLTGDDTAFSNYYGILGEDVYRQWNTMTINFNLMFVLLK